MVREIRELRKKKKALPLSHVAYKGDNIPGQFRVSIHMQPKVEQTAALRSKSEFNIYMLNICLTYIYIYVKNMLSLIPIWGRIALHLGTLRSRNES